MSSVVLTMTGNFLSRHTGACQTKSPGAILNSFSWPAQRAYTRDGIRNPVKTLSYWMLVYTSITVVLLVTGVLNPVYADTPQGPGLGHPASRKEITQWEIGIMPDGAGLPKGGGTARQGRVVYEKHCASCHGPEGSGGTADALAGAKMGLTSEYPEQTIGTYWPYATTLFDMTRRSMPMNAPGTLSNDDVYAVTAYLLYRNRIIGEKEQMNARTLPKIKMPNHNGFINVYEQEESKEN